MSGGPEWSRRSRIDVDIGGLRPNIGAGVQVPDKPVHQHGAPSGIGPAGSDNGKVQGGEVAAFFDACLELHVGRRTVAGAEIGFLSAEKKLNRPAGLLGQQGGYYGVLSGL